MYSNSGRPVPMFDQTIKIGKGEEKVDVLLKPTPRGGRTLKVQVHPTKGIIAFVPPHMTRDYVEDFVVHKKRWILRKAKEVKPIRSQRQQAASNEMRTIYYMGEHYKIDMIIVEGEKASIQLDKERKIIHIYAGSFRIAKATLHNWFLEQSYTIIGREVRKIALNLPWVRTLPPIRCRFLKSCWGKCKHDGTLTFNVHLLKAPLRCIHYVILHELCHIKEHNHSRKFWKLVEFYMPQRKHYEKYLKTHGPIFIPD